MKITSISYKKIFPGTQPFTNETIGIEIQVDEGDNAEYVFEVAKHSVERWHSGGSNVPNNVQDNVQDSVRNQVPIDPPYKDDTPVVLVGDDGEYVLGSLQKCKTIEELARIKAYLPKSLLPAYMNRMKQLTPKTI